MRANGSRLPLAFGLAVVGPLLAGGAFVPPVLGQEQRQPTPRPNILLILADDLGFSDLGCYGGEIETPNIDRLAAGGVRFSSFYSSARCCPSRASLLTGLHPHQAGIGSFTRRTPRPGDGPAYSGRLLSHCISMAEILRADGYSTWMVGKWHLGRPGPEARGFQNYFGYRDLFAYAADQWDARHYTRLPAGTAPEVSVDPNSFYATDVFSDYALSFVRKARQQKGKPWFLYLAHSSPHFPVQAPKATIDKYVKRYRRGWDVLRAERFDRMKRLGLVPKSMQLPLRSQVPVDRDDIANGYAGRPNPAWSTLPAARREDLARRMATYAAMVEHVDRGVGRLLDDLREHQELENTLVLFLSDNGACYEWGPFGFDGPSRKGRTDMRVGEALAATGQRSTHQSYGSAWANLSNTPLNMYKHFCHEGGITSPLIVHWPSKLPPRTAFVEDPAHIMDVAPTLLAAAGSKVPAKREGKKLLPLAGVSLLGACAGEKLSPRSLAFEHQGARALRSGDYKVVWSKREPTPARWRLFHIKEDRAEQRDLASAQPERTVRLVAAWEAWAKKVGAKPFHTAAKREPRRQQPQLPTPQVAFSDLRITCDVEAKGDHGVVVAHGGRRFGYALHLERGHLVFEVRLAGKLTRIRSVAPVKDRFQARVMLTATRMEMQIGTETVATVSPGLIPEQPTDGLQVGEDLQTAAGSYQGPNRLDGIVHAIEVVPTRPGARRRVPSARRR